MDLRKKHLLTYILLLSFASLFTTARCSGSEEYNGSLREIHFKINECISLYKQGRNREALPYIEDVINEGVMNPDIHHAAGEIYYAMNELELAVKHWKMSLSLSPDEAVSLKILKATKEIDLDSSLSDKTSCNFVLKYSQEDTYAPELILHTLVNAYNVLAYDLGWHKNSEFTVILYTNEDFTHILDVPSWAAAVYDGKIRIPFQYSSLNIERLESIIQHELTHAILHRIGGNDIPVWLHEGIAQYKDGIDDSPARNTLKDCVINNTLISISDLNTGFGRFKDVDSVKTAYAVSLGFIEYIIDNYGFYSVLDIINNINNYASLDELFVSTYGLDLRQMENRWIEQMTAYSE